jgi:hypothetical protein
MSILKKRDHYRPFQYPWAFEAYDMMQKMHWLPSEVPLQEDVVDWNKKLTPRSATCSPSYSASSRRPTPTSRPATPSSI